MTPLPPDLTRNLAKIACLVAGSVFMSPTVPAAPPASLPWASPEALAVRSLSLNGGGRLRVATRYNLQDYRAGQTIELDPVLESPSAPTARPPLILDSHVEVRRHGYAPCVSRARSNAADCVEGSSPTPVQNGSPSRFSFSFDRLFRISPEGMRQPAQGASYFGCASFLVTLRIQAGNGAQESVSFPVTITVQQTGRRSPAISAVPEGVIAPSVAPVSLSTGDSSLAPRASIAPASVAPGPVAP